MSNLLNPTIKFLKQTPELNSFIYQQIQDFDSFITEDTTVSIVARDPLKLMDKMEIDGQPMEPSKLQKMYRIAIVLEENDAKITEEGLSENLFEAIKMAKEKLMKRLLDIQDAVVSKQERIHQIQMALTNTQVH